MTAPIAASRANPRTLVPAARQMYEAGRTRSEVLTAIYGVDLPREAPLFLRDYVEGDRGLDVLWNVHPWEFMLPLDGGGPQVMIDDPWLEGDIRAYAQAPHIVILGDICYPRVANGVSLIAYDLNEVAVGRSTIVALPAGCRQVPESGAVFSPIGDSLIDVFSSVIADYTQHWEQWDNRTSAEELERAARQREGIEALRRELAAGQ